MKSNYKVQEFSLKRIMENLDKIPRNGVFEDDKPKLDPTQKRKLMDMVSRFNEYGRALQVEQALSETSKALSEIAQMAEIYACNEASDWFQQETIQKDFKDLKGRVQEFQKIAKDTYGSVQRLNALYEDMGHVLSRYYEIKDIQEVLRKGPSVDQDPVDRERQDMQDSEPQLMETEDIDEISLPSKINKDAVTGLDHLGRKKGKDLDEIRKSPCCPDEPLHQDGATNGRP